MTAAPEGEYRAAFARLTGGILDACRRHYGARLVSLAVFGSVGRGTPRPDSDVDLLIVAADLPRGRTARVKEFLAIERRLEPALQEARRQGLSPSLSPVFKSPEEASAGSPLFLDMLDDAQVLFDPDGFLAGVFDRLRRRLAATGARRVWVGSAWFWDLKPDYQPGDEFEL
jgi:hypothetical protein